MQIRQAAILAKPLAGHRQQLPRDGNAGHQYPAETRHCWKGASDGSIESPVAAGHGCAQKALSPHRPGRTAPGI